MLLVVCVLTHVYGWSDHALMLVAQIALDQLKDDGFSYTRRHLYHNPLSRRRAKPKDTDDLLGSILFYDKIKVLGDHSCCDVRWWESARAPVPIKGATCDATEDNLEYCRKFFRTLKLSLRLLHLENLSQERITYFLVTHLEAYQYSAGYWLRALVNLVAKLHQPLRNINACAPRFPGGDDSGTRWIVRSDILSDDTPSGHEHNNNIKNITLRQVWDTCGGLYFNATWPLSNSTRIQLEAEAAALRNEFPKSSFNNTNYLKNMTSFYRWHEEALAFADSIYDLPGAPYPGELPEDYLDFVRNVTKRQIPLAAYRIATILEGLPFFTTRLPGARRLI